MAGFSGGFSFGAKTTAPSTGGFAFGTPSTSQATGFGTPAQTTTATQGLSFGATTPATGFGVNPATTATGTLLGGGLTGLAKPASTATTGLTFGTPTTAPSALIGGPPGATGGFSFAKPATVAGVNPGATLTLGKPATTTTGFSLGGTTTTALGGGFGTGGLIGATATSGSIFGTTPAKTTASGLGGVDPKTTTATSGTASNGTKAGDGKTVKETPVEKEILLDVDNFTKFVKEEKAETEHIKRMSSTPMVKVQEDNAALRQLLSVVSSGLQRNVCNVDKLKREMTQELKNAEMAIRTKEIPPGLQFENTAPTQYFHLLKENFESQMQCYRQQIEMLENHLASLHQPSRLTAEELVMLLRRLHEAFIAMAAQLQQIHEAVKTQKEHYLSYRKVFLGDSRDIFQRQKKAPVKATQVLHTDAYGQPPFPGVNNAAAVAMATALTRSQQPQPQPGASQNYRNLFDTGGGLGGTAGQSTGFKGLFNTTTAAQPSSLFNTTLQATGTQQPQLNLSTATEQPFQLNKPPIGSKRGKR